MRKVSTLVGLTILALAATAGAQESAPAATTSAAPAAEPARRIQLGASFLPMALGKFTTSVGGTSSTGDMPGAFGFGLSAGYLLRPGLSLGLAPQMLFNLKPKGDGITPQLAMTEYDIMARIAYAHPLGHDVAIYGELLPGYSIVAPETGNKVKGMVLGFGVGLAIDMTRQTYATLGGGYQLGFQQRSGSGIETGDAKTRFVRVALSFGVRL